jgi:hypothetical protein
LVFNGKAKKIKNKIKKGIIHKKKKINKTKKKKAKKHKQL